MAARVGFGSGCPDLSVDHHYTFFGVQFRGLRPRLPSASHTASRRSHFGSATGPVASLWPGGIDRLTPTHPLGNIDVFQGESPLFRRPELFSARAAGWLGTERPPRRRPCAPPHPPREWQGNGGKGMNFPRHHSLAPIPLPKLPKPMPGHQQPSPAAAAGSAITRFIFPKPPASPRPRKLNHR
jgi:hypothetical protein